MPTAIIHEKIGYYCAERLGCSSYLFYLGLIAPDSNKIHQNISVSDRWFSHVRKRDLGEWRKSLRDFFLIEEKHYSYDFLLGYVIHILTDIIYDDFLYSDIIQRIVQSGVSPNEAHSFMFEDMDLYYFDEFEEISRLLSSSSFTYDILNVKGEDILLWKKKLLEGVAFSNKSSFMTDFVISYLEKKVFFELSNNFLV